MLKTTKTILFVGLLGLILLMPAQTHAFQLVPPGCTGAADIRNCGLTEIFQTFINFANFLLSIVGSVTLLMFIYGGFVWLTSGGATEKIKKGRDIMVNTVIGLLIMLAAATVIYSVGTFLCGDDQSCLRQLNIYGAAEGQDGGIDCRQKENDGKTCGTDKNTVCSYETRKCVTKCEADQNLASRGYACTVVPLAKKDKISASKYAESFDCRLSLCPGDWANLCCPVHEAATTCCQCNIGSDTTFLPSRSGVDCVTACTSMRDLKDSLTVPPPTTPTLVLPIPNVERTEEPGCEAVLAGEGL